MQCQICKNNEATIHLTEISNGIRSELHLCEYCAAEQQIAVKNQLPLNELLSSLLAAAPEEEQFTSAETRRLKCPVCGFTLEHLRNASLLGCPQDYEVFAQPLLPLIESIHDGKTLHCGKVPSTTPKRTKNQIELHSLKLKLEQAVKKEDYELAAKMRDQIAEKEKQEN